MFVTEPRARCEEQRLRGGGGDVDVRGGDDVVASRPAACQLGCLGAHAGIANQRDHLVERGELVEVVALDSACVVEQLPERDLVAVGEHAGVTLSDSVLERELAFGDELEEDGRGGERPGFCVCMIRKGGSWPRRRSRTS